MAHLSGEWKIVNGRKLSREFSLQSFRDAIDFVCGIAEIAERENHHPDIMIAYNKVVVDAWTHDSGGITEKDRFLTRAIDALYKARTAL